MSASPLASRTAHGPEKATSHVRRRKTAPVLAARHAMYRKHRNAAMFEVAFEEPGG